MAIKQLSNARPMRKIFKGIRLSPMILLTKQELVTSTCGLFPLGLEQILVLQSKSQNTMQQYAQPKNMFRKFCQRFLHSNGNHDWTRLCLLSGIVAFYAGKVQITVGASTRCRRV
jgi:hypothetical protein